MRAFPVILPSGVRYWTVLDDDLAPVPVADAFLRHVRLGRDGSELTTRSYAGSVALFLRWCAGTGRPWQAGVEQFALFMTWLAHAGPLASGPDAAGSGVVVVAGPGAAAATAAVWRRTGGRIGSPRHAGRGPSRRRSTEHGPATSALARVSSGSVATWAWASPT